MRSRNLLTAIVFFCVAGALTGAAAQQHKSIDLPWIAQRTPYECGRAILASLGAHYRRDARQTYDYILPMKPDGSAFSASHLVEEARELGLWFEPVQFRIFDSSQHCTQTQPVSRHFDGMVSSVRNGKPVVVIVTPNGSPHFVILTGYLDQKFEIHDPQNAEKSYIGRDELAAQMCTMGFQTWAVSFMPKSRLPLPLSRKNTQARVRH